MTSTEDRVRNTYRCPGWPIRLTEDEIAQAGTSRDSILLFLKFLRVFCFLTGSDSRNVNKLSRIFPETRIFIKKNLQKGKYAVSSQYVNKLSRIFVCLDRSFFYSFFFLVFWRDFNWLNRMIGAEQIGQHLTRVKQRDRISPKRHEREAF